MRDTIIIDGQLWQTGAFYRGMGGYVFGLLQALAKQREDMRFIVVLNSNMECGEARIDGIRRRLSEGVELHFLDLPHEPKPGVEELRAVRVLDEFIAREVGDKVADVYYFIPALFLFQFCAVFPSGVRKLLLFHDLMPLIYREELGKYFPGPLYFPRFATILAADIVFTNSATTAHDLQQYLGINPTHIANIDGSLNEQLLPGDDDSKIEAESILDRVELRDKQFILMPTGGLENKNNSRAAEAFMSLRETLTPKLQLVVTSSFEDLARRELTLIAGENITFTGNISDEDLLLLFENCQAVLMPSLYEGLGLPVLEGIAHGKPVACSDVPVFREIPHFRQALYVFNPYDVEDITEALLQAVSQAGFDRKSQHYPQILAKYSWDRTAGLFTEALAKPQFYTRPSKPKTRIAVTCPDPRRNADVAVFAQRMHGFALLQGVELVYFIDPGIEDHSTEPHADFIRYTATCYEMRDIYAVLPTLTVDAVLHVLSGDAQFTQQLRAALSIPGFVYIGSPGYRPTIEDLAQQQMISSAQSDTERGLYEAARKNKEFETPSVLASAKGVITERHVHKKITSAIKTHKLKVPVLEVPECSVVNFDAKALDIQKDTYGQVIDFIRKGRRR